MAVGLEGKVVLITGAGRGIGRATAELLARRGARLVLNDLGCDVEGRGADPSVIEDVAGQLRAAGAEVVDDSGDATKDVARLIELACATFGQLDAVVSCIGSRWERSLLRLDDADVERIFEVGFHGPRRLLRAAAAHWTEARLPGRAILCAGPAAFFGTARQGAVGAAQAALVALARAAAVELRRHAIGINVVVPTARTRLTEDLPLFQGIGEGSMTPQNVAAVLAFLVSDDALEVHGEVLGVAGGRLYAVQSRETTGAFLDQADFTPEDVAAAWPEVTQP